MTDPTSEDARSSREAADWFAKLNGRSVDGATLEQFYRWRREPAHAHAYERLEQVWRRSGAAGDDREIAVAVRSALERRGLRQRVAELIAQIRRPQLAALGAAGVALMLIALLVAPGQPIRFETRVGEQRLVRLEDGTQVRLNTDSEVGVRFSKTRRLVELGRGQAFFDVVSDRGRPFIVKADGAEIEAIGTRFDVLRSNAAVRVVLVEGSVRVVADTAQPGGDQLLAPGQALLLGSGGDPEPKPVDVASATSWMSGRLSFRETPLGEAVTEVNRYSEHKVELLSNDFAGVRINGDFRTGDIEAFVTAVTTLFPLRAVRTRDNRTELVRGG